MEICSQKQRYVRQLRTSRRWFMVLIVVIGFNCCRSPLLRMGGSPLGYVSAISHRYAWAWWIQQYAQFAVNHHPASVQIRLYFSFHQFLVVGTIYLLSVLEESAISPPRQWFPAAPFRGKSSVPTERRRAGRWSGFCYRLRVGSLPLTTFAQNNGVIQMTASLHVMSGEPSR